MSRSLGRVLLAAAVVCLTAHVAIAQQTSTDVKKFEVIAVDGNDLVVRLPEGTRQITVPEDFRFTVDGQQMSVRQLRPGMAGTAVITTRTTMTPVTVTEVKNGTVALVSGNSVYVRTGNDVRLFNQSELDKRGIKIMMDGKPRQVSELHAGDQISATIVTTGPPRVVTEREVQATLAKQGTAPAGPLSSAASAVGNAASAVGGAVAGAATGAARAITGSPSADRPAPQQTGTEARALPRTAGTILLTGLTGVSGLIIGAGFTVRRRRRTR